MHIYFSGVGGVGIGPLAHIALDAGYSVSGSDQQASDFTASLQERGATILIGQDGSQIADTHAKKTIDWVVHTAALKQDHPELQFAKEHTIKFSKRDEFLARIIDDKQLKLIAVSGTHGKTTTTALLIWLFMQCKVPISYSVGTTLSFGPSGRFDPDSAYFVYECDEYDRNFLHFTPWVSLIPSVDYDHPDIYPTRQSYKDAYIEFLGQSEDVYAWKKDIDYLTDGKPLRDVVTATISDSNSVRLSHLMTLDDTADTSTIPLAGEHNRRNGLLATTLVADGFNIDRANDKARLDINNMLHDFPGTGRRFEKLADNLYSDYGHHPKEIAATLQLAREISDRVVIVYQPHQNTRQHEVRNDYKTVFDGADTIYWLPTYLSREDESLPILEPEDLIAGLDTKRIAQAATLDDQLWKAIQNERQQGKLVLLMGAGTIDSWARDRLTDQNTQSTK